MTKLYKIQNGVLHYWQTWDKNPIVSVLYWGIVGERGTTTTISATGQAKRRVLIQQEVDKKRTEGFAEFLPKFILGVEYKAKSMTTNSSKKVQRLSQRLDELMGWTGLGHLDGSGFGFGKMDVSVGVVDFEIAKRVIELDLEDTEFANYINIHQIEISAEDNEK